MANCEVCPFGSFVIEQNNKLKERRQVHQDRVRQGVKVGRSTLGALSPGQRINNDAIALGGLNRDLLNCVGDLTECNVAIGFMRRLQNPTGGRSEVVGSLKNLIVNTALNNKNGSEG